MSSELDKQRAQRWRMAFPERYGKITIRARPQMIRGIYDCYLCGTRFMRTKSASLRDPPQFCSKQCKHHRQRKPIKRKRQRSEADRKRSLQINKSPRALLYSRLGARLRNALAKAGLKKSTATSALIGCSFTYLREHIEKQFLPRMTWANRHLCHIDHIRPCAQFDLSDPQQQRICFHFTNLRPLWRKQNMRKHAQRLFLL